MPTSKRKTLTVGAIIAIVIGIAVAIGVGSPSAEPKESRPLLRVAVQAIELQDGYDAVVTYPGRVQAARRSLLGFERGGRLAEVHVDDGDRVTEGSVIARLDQRQIKAQLAAAKANIAATKAALTQAEARLALSQSTQDRQRTLLSKGHISQQRFDDADFDLRAADAGVETAKARLIQARADAEAVSVALALSDLVAPFDGQVVRRQADEGTVLSPGAPVLTLEETGAAEFISGIPLSALGSVKVGQTAKVEIGAIGYSAEITRIVTALDTATRTAQLVLALPDTAAGVSGEVGTLALSARQPSAGFWAPMEALQEGARGLWTIYVAAPDGTEAAIVERHPVEVLYTGLNRAYVRGTPDDGALMITRGVARLVPGQRVLVARPTS